LKNSYEIRGETTVIFLNSKKYGPKETYIATSDLEKAKEFSGTWYPCPRGRSKGLYVLGTYVNESNKRVTVCLHRWILGITDIDVIVDHILHDTLDNCRWALNIVTHAENHQNLELPSNNTSGHIGVSWHKKAGKWQARLNINGETKHLGLFENMEDAIYSRKEAEKRYFEYKRSIS
jgi:hypothetical protein